MVNTTSINNALSYSSDLESDHENENEKTPFVSSKQNNHRVVLSGNTLLANGGHSSSDHHQTKAPKKQKRIMKASKRFKIFGNMTIAGGRNNVDKDRKKDKITKSAYDFGKVGQSRYVREFQQSYDKEPEPHETIYYERVINKHLSSNDTLLNSTNSDSQTMDVSRSHSSENHDMKVSYDRSRSHSSERSQRLPMKPTNNGFINAQPGVRQTNMIPQQMINPITMKRDNKNHVILPQVTNKDTYRNLYYEHSDTSRYDNLHNIKHLHGNRIPSQLPMTNTGNSFDININMYNRNSTLRNHNIDQGLCNNDDIMSKVSELSMTSPTADSNKSYFLDKMLHSCYQGENQDRSTNLCSAATLNPRIEEESDSDDSSSQNSDGLSSSVVEIAVEAQQVLSKVSTISSNSEDVVETESEDDVCTQDENETKSEIPHPKSKILIQTKKLLSLIQGKFSDCFVPDGFSSSSGINNAF